MEYDFSGFHQPTPQDLTDALRTCATDMLQPPIRSMGVAGIRTAGQRVLAWPEVMDNDAIAAACFNTALYIRADAGTGGGLFRWMYAAFLRECAQRLSRPALLGAAEDMQAAGDRWESLADQIEPLHSAAELRAQAGALAHLFEEIASAEDSAWSAVSAAIA